MSELGFWDLFSRTYALAALDPAKPGQQAALANFFVIFLRFLSA